MITLIGIRPGKPGDSPLTPTGGSTSSADRLRIICGMSVDEFLEAFPRRYNVSNGVSGDLGDRVAVLGREAWVALGLPRTTGFFGRVKRSGVTYILLPHPSGRSLLYNSPRVRARVKRELKRWP